MDGSRFDAITKVVAVGSNRRALVKALLGGAVTTTVGHRTATSVSAAKSCTRASDCGPSQICNGNRCYRCPSSESGRGGKPTVIACKGGSIEGSGHCCETARGGVCCVCDEIALCLNTCDTALINSRYGANFTSCVPG